MMTRKSHQNVRPWTQQVNKTFLFQVECRKHIGNTQAKHKQGIHVLSFGSKQKCKTTCTSCRSQARIWAWCSSRNVQNTSVKQWLQRHSYNGKTFLKHDSRTPTAIVELFKGVAASTANLQESQSSKPSHKTSQMTTRRGDVVMRHNQNEILNEILMTW